MEIFALEQNRPNPFSPYTRISFAVPGQTGKTLVPTSLCIYDLQGRLVRTVIDDTRPAGRYSVSWDGRDSGGRNVTSGVYFYRLEAGRSVASGRMALLR